MGLGLSTSWYMVGAAGSRVVGPPGAGVPLGPTHITSYLCSLSLSRVDNIKFPVIWEVILRVCVCLLYFFILF